MLNEYQTLYLDNVELITDNIGKTKSVSYDFCPLYMICKLGLDKKYYLEKTKYFLILRNTKTINVALLPLIDDATVIYFEMLNILHTNKIIAMPYRFAKPLMGNEIYTVRNRLWGNIDFVFQTKQIIEKHGKKLSRVRNYANRYEKDQNYEVIDLLDERRYLPKVKNVLDKWNTLKGREASRTSFVPYIISILDELTDIPRLNFISMLDKTTGELGAVSMATLFSTTHWVNTFRYSDHVLNNATDYLFGEMAKRYLDIPFEIDGAAGGRETDLAKVKQKYITDNVLNEQIYCFDIGRKGK
jgi:hypothetical protein